MIIEGSASELPPVLCAFKPETVLSGPERHVILLPLHIRRPYSCIGDNYRLTEGVVSQLTLVARKSKKRASEAESWDASRALTGLCALYFSFDILRADRHPRLLSRSVKVAWRAYDDL